MKIVAKREYLESLKAILTYISQDSRNKAVTFKRQLDVKIDNLVYFPYKYRASIHNEDKNVRDLIFKGYTITYLIETDKERIFVLDIFKWVDR